MSSSAAPGNCHDLSGTGKERRRCRSRFPWARLHGENSSVHPRSIRLRRSYIRRSVLFCTWPRLNSPRCSTKKSIFTEATTTSTMPAARSSKKAVVLCLFQSFAGMIFGWENSSTSGLYQLPAYLRRFGTCDTYDPSGVCTNYSLPTTRQSTIAGILCIGAFLGALSSVSRTMTTDEALAGRAITKRANYFVPSPTFRVLLVVDTVFDELVSPLSSST